MENLQSNIPETSGYLILKKACRMLREKEIKEEEFLNILDWLQNLVEDTEIQFNDILTAENMAQEELEKVKVQYMAGIAIYKEALIKMEDYLTSSDIKSINIGLKMALMACEKLLKIKDMINIKGLEKIYNDRLLSPEDIPVPKYLIPSVEEDREIKERLKKSRKKSEIVSLIPLFRVLGEEKVEKLEKRIKMKKFEKNQILFRQGDKPEELYIIKSGEITFYNEKNKTPVITLSKGDLFGEMSIILSSPRTLSAGVTSSSAEVYVITRIDFLYMLNRYPELSINLSKILCERLKERGEQIVALSEHLIY